MSEIVEFCLIAQNVPEGDGGHSWWQLKKGKGQESSGCSVELTWHKQYTGR